MNAPQPPPLLPSSFSKRNATLVKMIGIFLLALFLLVPMGFIGSVLHERLQRRNEAVLDITSTWGRDQAIVGPVLMIPYRHFFKGWEDKVVQGKIEKVEVIQSAIANACFLPADLMIEGSIHPNKKHRGIYEAVVYSGEIKLSGRFTTPDFESLKIKKEDILWNDSVVTFAIPDLRGAKETLYLACDTNRFLFVPGTKLHGFASGVHAKIANLPAGGGELPFTLDLTLNGSSSVSFAPVGIQTVAKLASPWPDPSFRGAFLPIEHRISASGFEAQWKISYYGRSYPQQWTDQTAGENLTPASAGASQFGVAFLTMVDSYRNVERSFKYGILFIALVFATFFLFEMLCALRIHPFQYVLVGGALCLFYLVLLSLSEFIPFSISYLTASASATLMITLYSLKFLNSGKRTALITGLLCAIYGFLYIALQLQDYSLLFGTAGLVTVLAVVMYVTRNIDWYRHDAAS